MLQVVPQMRRCDMHELLNIHDVARMLQISARKIELMVASGELPRPIRLGRLRRWRPDTIEAWLANLVKAEPDNRGPGRRRSGVG